MISRHSTKAARIALVLGLAALLAMAGMCAVGCADEQKSSGSRTSSVSVKKASTGPLKVAVQSNALSIPTVYADRNGLFSDAGLEIELYTFVNGAEENKALEKGEADIASDGLASVYMLSSGNFSWIGESDNASSTVGIYVQAGTAPTLVSGQLASSPDALGSADTLHGLTVVGPAGTMEEWVTASYFARFGLEAGKDYEFIEMDRDQAAESVINGEADVFVATDIDYSRIMDDAGLVALARGTDATSVSFNNGYLVSNKILESRHDDLVTFLQVVYEAAEILDDNPQLYEEFAFDYYKSNGKPTTRADVKLEAQARDFLVPADFEVSTYRLGSGVLDVGLFNESIGALSDEQVQNIRNSIYPKLLDDALGITVEPAEM